MSVADLNSRFPLPGRKKITKEDISVGIEESTRRNMEAISQTPVRSWVEEKLERDAQIVSHVLPKKSKEEMIDTAVEKLVDRFVNNPTPRKSPIFQLMEEAYEAGFNKGGERVPGTWREHCRDWLFKAIELELYK